MTTETKRQRKNWGSEVYNAWIYQRVAYGQNRTNGNVFFERNILYSYGHHFMLGAHTGNELILNADRYSSTTAGQQAALRRAAELSSYPTLLVPFSALRAAGINPEYVHIVDAESDREIPWTRKVKVMKQTGEQWWQTEWTGEWKVEHGTSHPMGRSTFRVGRKFYISGIDETSTNLWNGYFLAQLPRKAHTVADAVEMLKPQPVVDAETAGVTVHRQGEWFFVSRPTVETRTLTPVENSYLPHRDRQRITRHRVTELRRSADGELFARGTVRHSGGEHRMLKLGKIWHEVFENTEVASFTALGMVD